MKQCLAAAALLLAAALTTRAAAAQASADEPLDPPRPGKALRDGDFGVVSRQFGLERQVEMYQWRASAGGYTRVWHAAAIDSSSFAPGHANPGRIPLEGRRWWS